MAALHKGMSVMTMQAVFSEFISGWSVLASMCLQMDSACLLLLWLQCLLSWQASSSPKAPPLLRQVRPENLEPQLMQQRPGRAAYIARGLCPRLQSNPSNSAIWAQGSVKNLAAGFLCLHGLD